MADFEYPSLKETDLTPEEADQVFQYELEDLDPSPGVQKVSFSFDQEIQRNFDPGNVQKAKEGVEEIFRDAIDRLRAQSERIRGESRQEGYKTGYEDGFKAGEEAAKIEFTPFLETLNQLVDDLSGFRSKMFAKTEREMIEMIVGLTKRVIHFELTSRENSIQDIIRLAAQSVLDRERMVIKVNPADKMHAETYRPELQHLLGEIKNLTIEGQPSIQRGGCIVETNFGSVDARVENLYEQIDQILQMAPPQEELHEMPATPIDPLPAEDNPDSGEEPDPEAI